MSGGGGGSQTVGYRYYLGMHLGVCVGPVDALLEIRVGDRTAWSGNVTASGTIAINAPDLFGGEEKEGGIAGALDVMMGEATQMPNAYLSAKQSGPQPAYRGLLSFVWKQGFIGANNPYMKPWAQKVRRILKGWQGGVTAWYSTKAEIALPSGDKAMNPAHIVYECLTNADWGMGYPGAQLDDAAFRAAADTFHGEGLGLCLQWTRQNTIEAFLKIIMDHVGAVLSQDATTGLFVLRPIRGDYVVGSLPTLDESNIIALESYERPSTAEATNEVSVTYDDVATGKSGTVTVQNLAAITSQGGTVTKSMQYPGIPTASLAVRIAMRDLLAVSTPLARVRLKVNRQAYNLIPGSVFVLSWPKLGISSLVLRVLAANFGTLADGTISLDCAEDVFGLPAAGYAAQQPSGWSDPNNDPAPAAVRLVDEAPRYELARTMGASDFAGLAPDAGYLYTVAAKPTSDAIGYRIATRPGTSGAFSDAGADDFAPTGQLVATLAPGATSATLTNVVDGELIAPGTYAIIDAEIVRVDTINTTTGAITLGRGVLDTVAASHAAGAVMFFADGFSGTDGVERVDGDVMQAKILPRTGRGTLAEASAPEDTLTFDQRAFRPYPPGRVRIGGVAYPSTVTGPATVTWAHRDRTAQNLQGDETGSIGPEAGTTYNVRFYNDTTNALVASSLGQTGTSYTINVGGAFTARLELESVRDGLTSRQKHAIVFAYSKAVDDVVTETDDMMVTEAGDQITTE